MFRPCLLAAICLSTPVIAQDVRACRNIPFSQDNCVRFVGCIGDQGLRFDGKARGWDQGTATAEISDFTQCRGTWDSTGRAIQVWSGKNVLEFLTPDGSNIAYLPCISGDIPLS